MFSDKDIFWMQRAIDLAKQAANEGEIPVGALLIQNDEVIGEGFNRSITHCDPTAHAEIMALRMGAEKIGNYRLLQSTLYVTLEPCLMCAGALVHARIERVIFGALDPKAGAIVSQTKALEYPYLNHKVQHLGGLLGEHCGHLLSEFFRERRKQA